MPSLVENLQTANACYYAREWIKIQGIRDIKTAWADCDRADWMLWLLCRVNRESRAVASKVIAKMLRVHLLPLYDEELSPECETALSQLEEGIIPDYPRFQQWMTAHHHSLSADLDDWRGTVSDYRVMRLVVCNEEDIRNAWDAYEFPNGDSTPESPLQDDLLLEEGADLLRTLVSGDDISLMWDQLVQSWFEDGH